MPCLGSVLKVSVTASYFSLRRGSSLATHSSNASSPRTSAMCPISVFGSISISPASARAIRMFSSSSVAVATLCRLTGDLDAAEDAVQDACVAALERWPVTGVPGNARGWLIGVARHKAVDRMRREAIRGAKEAASVRELDEAGHGPDIPAEPADTLSLMFLCCHPALDASARVALTLRSVCGLPTAEIAAAFLVPEETMAKRLVRAKAKIRDARIPFRVPGQAELPGRLGGVLRVIYVLFTEGHMASRGEALVRGDLCDTAISLARAVAGLLPGEPEAMGLLALLLLTDARRAARTDEVGDLVLLEDQDRSRWDGDMEFLPGRPQGSDCRGKKDYREDHADHRAPSRVDRPP